MSVSPPQGLASENAVPLALRLSRGDVAALEEVLCTLGPRVAAGLHKRHAALRTEDVEDILSAASHRLWQSRRQYDSARGSLGSWFFIIADNLARDFLRKEARHKPQWFDLDQLAAIEYQHYQADDTETRSGTSRQLNEIVDRLPPLDRCIITGFAQAGGEGPWAADLARQLGMRAGTIRVRCQRIKARIRKQMDATALAAVSV